MSMLGIQLILRRMTLNPVHCLVLLMLCPITPSQAIYSGAMWRFEMSIASIYRADPVNQIPQKVGVYWGFDIQFNYVISYSRKIWQEIKFGSLVD